MTKTGWHEYKGARCIGCGQFQYLESHAIHCGVTDKVLWGCPCQRRQQGSWGLFVVVPHVRGLRQETTWRLLSSDTSDTVAPSLLARLAREGAKYLVATVSKGDAESEEMHQRL